MHNMGIWAGSVKPRKISRRWSKFPFDQQVGKKLAGWGCHRPELDVQPRPAVECWEVLPVPLEVPSSSSSPLTLLGWCFLLTLPLAPPAGTALSPGVCHALALPPNDPGGFAVCELLPIFPPSSFYYICDLWAAADVLSRRICGLFLCQGNDIC